LLRGKKYATISSNTAKAMKEKSTQEGSTREAASSTGSAAGKKPAEVLSGAVS
jgi:hypothetical protein